MATSKADTITNNTPADAVDVLEAPQPTEPIKVQPPLAQPPLVNIAPPKRESRIFLLSNDKRRGTVIVDVEEDVIDPASITPQNPDGKVRRMRLLRGAQTIWFDEQSPQVFPKEYVAKNVLSLHFQNGKCIIPVIDRLRVQAAELSNRNMGNKIRQGAKDIYFYEWNPAEQAEKAIQEENDVIKAMEIAFKAEIKDIIPHAQYMGVQFTDVMGIPLDDNSIRSAYVKAAKNNAKKFLSSIHSPTVQIAHKIRKAIDGGLIDMGRQAGAAYWTDGGFITAVPLGRDQVDFLIEFAQIPGEANSAFVSQLRELIK